LPPDKLSPDKLAYQGRLWRTYDMMCKSNKEAVTAWVNLLGAERVLTDTATVRQAERNLSGLERHIPAILQPLTTEEVRGIVEIANRFQAPLWPVSTGCNWGLGCKAPVMDDTTLVDLSRMNRIIEVNVPLHYAVIEPGVTQRQLYDYIREHHLPLRINVTGSAGCTSLIGNALDRGVGYFASRADSLSALEVILGSGERIQTGAAHYPTSKTAFVNRHGIGPSLNGLFAQSSYGIVTRACVDLIPEREAHVAMLCKLLPHATLSQLVDALAQLTDEGVIETAVHIANRARTEISVAPAIYTVLRREGMENETAHALALDYLRREKLGNWSAVGSLMGSKAMLRVARARIRQVMRGIASVQFINDFIVNGARRLAAPLSFIPFVRRKRAFLESAVPMFNMSKGVPTDAALGSVYWPVTGNDGEAFNAPVESGCGLMYCLPMIAMRGADAEALNTLTEETCNKHGFTPYITLNLVDGKALECVMNIAFNRADEGATARAHTCMDEWHQACMTAGYIPYRVGIAHMHHVIDPADTFWQTVQRIKQALDPLGIIAPGRYAPGSDAHSSTAKGQDRD